MMERRLTLQPARVCASLCSFPSFSVFGVLVFLMVTALVVAPRELGAVELYRSNPAGIRGEPIEQSDRGDAGYVLEIREKDGERERVLLHDGTIVRRERYITDGRGRLLKEERYEDGELRHESLYNERGLVREKREYDEAGELVERIELEYDDGRRVRERHFDAGDQLKYTDTFEYDADGRVRRVSRVRDDEVARVTLYAYAEGRLFEESFRNGEQVNVVRYDASGRVVFRSERREGEVVRRQEYRYQDDGERLIVTRDSGEPGVRFERFVDGQLVSSRVEIDGEVVSRSTQEYDEGDLVRVVTEGRDLSGRRVEEYEYDEDGKLVRKVVHSDGRRLREINYRGERGREEITYRNGEPFLRITYQDGNPVSRELVAEE